MSRYIKNVARVSASLGPTEERGVAMWAGYEIVGVDEDLSTLGLLKVSEAGDRGVTTFTIVQPDDIAMYEKLGLRRKV